VIAASIKLWTPLWDLVVKRKTEYQFEPYIGVDASIPAALDEFELHLKQTYGLRRQGPGARNSITLEPAGEPRAGPSRGGKRVQDEQWTFSIFTYLETWRSAKVSKNPLRTLPRYTTRRIGDSSIELGAGLCAGKGKSVYSIVVTRVGGINVCL
jgi:hypothetical protein